MRYRSHRGEKISEVGFGCYSLSGAYGAKDPEDVKKVIVRAHDLGVNFFDTAEGYGNAEKILGEVIKPFRDDVFLCTKVGFKGSLTPNLKKGYVKKACADSLERLGTDSIDLYQVHFNDSETPVAETVEALDELRDDGKIVNYGVGHLPASRIGEYCRKGDVFSVMMELSPVTRLSRQTLLPLCKEFGTAALAFSVTGRGVLTGKFRKGKVFEEGDIRNMDALFQRESFDSALRTADKLAELGKTYGKTPAQVAVAWVLAQPNVACALTGPSTIAHLEENLGGSGWTISRRDLDEMEGFFKKEETWLDKRRRDSIRKILAAPLKPNRTEAVADLVYVLENAVALELAEEKDVLPLLREILAAREMGTEDESIKALVRVQRAISETLSKVK